MKQKEAEWQAKEMELEEQLGRIQSQNQRLETLRHLHQPTFDPESKDLIPHSSVKFDQFEDQLEGRPITLIVHPLLQLYGTNDAKNYDQGSVWAPAEVWLDSRKPTQ